MRDYRVLIRCFAFVGISIVILTSCRNEEKDYLPKSNIEISNDSSDKDNLEPIISIPANPSEVLQSTIQLELYNAPQNAEEFCNFNESDYQNLLLNSQNLLAFTNHGGLLNGGVCWWHSRFTRNATYLAIYNPLLPKLTENEYEEVIKKIIDGNKVVVIPGYKNLSEFSSEHEKEIQDELEDWQKFEGFIEQSWLNGLTGSSKINSEKLLSRMQDLYELVNIKKHIVYQKLQVKGIVSHSWLVFKMEKDGLTYKIWAVDSSFKEYIVKSYKSGDESMSYGGDADFVPYTQREKSFKRYHKAIQSFCSKYNGSSFLNEQNVEQEDD